MKPYYQDEKAGIVIYCGDCREILPTLGAASIDLVLTDPPYGINHKSNGQIFLGSRPIAGDADTSLANWARAWAGERPSCVFFSPYVPLSGFRSVLVWDKGAHVGIGGDRETCWKRDFELIGVERNRHLQGCRDSAILRFNALSPPPSGHFAEKPVGLMRYLTWKLGGGAIVDPFMGSGSTLVAAKLEGRRAIGIEIDEQWCAKAANRLRQEVLF